MDRRLVALAAVVGFLSVALGAFGAHALDGFFDAHVSDGGYRRDWWAKAVHYHQVHAVLLFALGAWTTPAPEQARMRRAAFFAVFLGVCVFSGSLYTMALTGVRVLGAVTPIGGVAFLVGWVMAGWAAMLPRS